MYSFATEPSRLPPRGGALYVRSGPPCSNPLGAYLEKLDAIAMWISLRAALQGRWVQTDALRAGHNAVAWGDSHLHHSYSADGIGRPLLFTNYLPTQGLFRMSSLRSEYRVLRGSCCYRRHAAKAALPQQISHRESIPEGRGRQPTV